MLTHNAEQVLDADLQELKQEVKNMNFYFSRTMESMWNKFDKLNQEFRDYKLEIRKTLADYQAQINLKDDLRTELLKKQAAEDANV